MNRAKDPIGVFDSGVGGISVLREIIRLLPNENYIYFGDSANAPYGTKTTDEVKELTIHNIGKLVDQGVKAAVVACNTATSAAIVELREIYRDIPVIGIEPAVKPAALSKEHGKVLVMATPMTIHEEKLHGLVSQFEDRAEIYLLACPDLVEFVEAGDVRSPELRSYLEEIFAPYRESGIDGIVLGCTHFPFARALIQEIWGPETAIFDGAPGTARELKRKLEKLGWLNDAGERGRVEMKNSLGAGEEELGRRLLTMSIDA